jgi:hypothetical protein
MKRSSKIPLSRFDVLSNFAASIGTTIALIFMSMSGPSGRQAPTPFANRFSNRPPGVGEITNRSFGTSGIDFAKPA